MHINSLRAVSYTQNQNNPLCIPLCTMAESRAHPALLIVAPECGAGKAASVTFADAVAEGVTPLCMALVLNQGRKDHVCILLFFHSHYRQMGDRLLLSHPTAQCTQAAKSWACTTCLGSFTATLLCHSCCLAHIWELQTLCWLHSNLCWEGNNSRLQANGKSTTPLLVLPVKLNSGLTSFLFQQEKNNMKCLK